MTDKKIGIISDVHSNKNALDTVLDDIENYTDHILCAGDLTGYYVKPKEVIEAFKEKDIDSVMGNHDAAITNRLSPRYFNHQGTTSINYNREVMSLKDFRYLEELPMTYEKMVDDKHLFMVHGSPNKPLREYVYENTLNSYFLDNNFDKKPDVLIMGHTHLPYVERIDDTLIINPGSVGQPRDGNPEASYALLDIDDMEAELKRCEYDIEKTKEESRGKIDDRTVERLSKGL